MELEELAEAPPEELSWPDQGDAADPAPHWVDAYEQ